MPLLPGRKNIGKNVKEEEKAGKDPKQSIAIALNVSKKRKKFAKGGAVNESAASENRPSTQERDKDAGSIARNSGNKAPSQDKMTDTPERAQSMKVQRLQPLAKPALPASPVFKVRRVDEMGNLLKSDESKLMSSAAPGNPGAQPKKAYDEEEASKSGPSTPSLKMKKMAEGGMVNNAVSIMDADEDLAPHMGSKAGRYPAPSEAEYMATHFAEGGEVGTEEEEIEHAASIAAAIMAKRKAFAQGGMVDDEPLEQNAIEHGNEADELNMDALGKENYSEASALEDAHHPEDSNLISPEHDEENVNDKSIVGAIRKKMKMRSAITK